MARSREKELEAANMSLLAKCRSFESDIEDRVKAYKELSALRDRLETSRDDERAAHTATKSLLAHRTKERDALAWWVCEKSGLVLPKV
jgi:hypothetical protein